MLFVVADDFAGVEYDDVYADADDDADVDAEDDDEAAAALDAASSSSRFVLLKR